MKLKLYEVAVLLHPVNEEIDTTEIISEKVNILAKDDKTAGMLAVRKIPAKYDKHLDRVEVIVRPF